MITETYYGITSWNLHHGYFLMNKVSADPWGVPTALWDIRGGRVPEAQAWPPKPRLGYAWGPQARLEVVKPRGRARLDVLCFRTGRIHVCFPFLHIDDYVKCTSVPSVHVHHVRACNDGV